MDDERGATLVELVVAAGIAAVGIATFGAFFLAGPSAAVASAARDVGAAFDEARRTAAAFDGATVVFRAVGGGFSLRVYRRLPGDAGFAPAPGPAYDSTAGVTETAAPLGAPGIAFAVDPRGALLGYASFAPDAASFTMMPCPAGGAYVLALRAGAETRLVRLPCALAPTGSVPATFATAPPGVDPPSAPSPPVLACGGGTPCPLPTLPGIAALTVPPAVASAAPSAAPPTQAPTAAATVAPSSPPRFAGSIAISFWVEECPGGPATCDGGSLLEDDSPTTFLGGPTDYVACNIDPHPLGALPRTIANPGATPREVSGATAVAPFGTFVRYETRWDIIVPPGVTLTIADPGNAGC
jgi:hypothetical protein